MYFVAVTSRQRREEMNQLIRRGPCIRKRRRSCCVHLSADKSWHNSLSMQFPCDLCHGDLFALICLCHWNSWGIWELLLSHYVVIVNEIYYCSSSLLRWNRAFRRSTLRRRHAFVTSSSKQQLKSLLPVSSFSVCLFEDYFTEGIRRKFPRYVQYLQFKSLSLFVSSQRKRRAKRNKK